MKLLEYVVKSIRDCSAGDYRVTLYDFRAMESTTLIAGNETKVAAIIDRFLNPGEAAENYAPFSFAAVENSSGVVGVLHVRNGIACAVATKPIGIDRPMTLNEQLFVIAKNVSGVGAGTALVKHIAEALPNSALLADDTVRPSILDAHADYIRYRKDLRNYGAIVNPMKMTELMKRVANGGTALAYQLTVREAGG